MSEWRTVVLDDVISLQRGYDLPTPARAPGNVPVVGAAGVSGWHEIAMVDGPGVVIGRAGASMGKATYIARPFWPLNTALFVTDFRGNNPRFIYYLLTQIDFSGFNSGAAQPMLNRNYIKQLPLCVPDPRVQDAIADILGSLDDKIAVNEKIAEASHELALMQYRRTAGRRPLMPLSSIARPLLGGTPDRREGSYWGPGVPWASARDVASCRYGCLIQTAESITPAAADINRFRPLPRGSVLLTARGTVGAVARACQDTAINQSCYALVPSEAPPGVLYLMVLAAADQMISVAHGTVFSTLNIRSFDYLRVPTFAAEELHRLECKIGPLLDAIEGRLKENLTLAELRDVLLPRLMSGELRVTDAEKMVI